MPSSVENRRVGGPRMPLHRVTVATQPVGRRFQTLRGWTAMRWTVVILVAAGSALALGVSGALRYFAPLQPLLAVASLAVVGGALWARLGALSACPVTASGPM